MDSARPRASEKMMNESGANGVRSNSINSALSILSMAVSEIQSLDKGESEIQILNEKLILNPKQPELVN